MKYEVYGELELVEKPAIELFNSLGYEHADCFDERFGKESSLGRETTIEVVLIPRLTDSLIRLNPKLPSEALNLAFEELIRDRSSLNPLVANRKIYKMLRDGVKVSSRNEKGEEIVFGRHFF